MATSEYCSNKVTSYQDKKSELKEKQKTLENLTISDAHIVEQDTSGMVGTAYQMRLEVEESHIQKSVSKIENEKSDALTKIAEKLDEFDEKIEYWSLQLNNAIVEEAAAAETARKEAEKAEKKKKK